MSKFDRTWTMQLAISKAQFIDSFYSVVKKSDWSFRPPFDYKEFYGRVYSDKFFISKPRLSEVKGKMINDTNGLTLELKMEEIIWLIYGKLFITGLGLTVVCVLLLNSITFLFGPIPERFIFLYYSIALPVMFVLVWYIQIRVFHKWQDYFKKRFTRAILEIEKRAIQC